MALVDLLQMRSATPLASSGKESQVNIIDKADEEIRAIAEPLWRDLLKHSNEGEYGEFVKNFSSSMPFNAPGSLSDDDTYSLVAYILSEAKIIKPTEIMDAKTLPAVAMPNKDGFVPDPRPEVELYR